MAGGEDAGSFWATFGGGAAGAPEPTPLEQLLQTPGCSVEALLDEEDVIQEFKSCNERLVSRFCEPDAAKVLMECITCEPPPNASGARCFRHPFVAVELITCAPARFHEALVSPEQTEAMDLLWSFLGSTPPAQVNPVLAGYFSRTAATLFGKYPSMVVDYLRRRGTEKLLEEFLDRLHLRSLAELLARLLCAETESQVVFQTSDLVSRLLARWQDVGDGSDAQENVSLVIAELLSQKDDLCWIEDLTNQLTAPSTVNFLMDHIFSQQACGVPPAASLLTTVILHTTAEFREGMSVCASTPTLSPLSPPSPALVGEDDVVNVGVDEPVVGEAALSRPAPGSPPSSPAHRGSNSEEWFERRRASLMREVAAHFPRLRELLDSSLSQPASDLALAMPQGTICAIGGTTLEVISLISTLSRTGLEVVLEAVLNNQLLPRCIEVFFRHPWSSLLHNSVRLLLSEVLSSSDDSRIDLVRQLLKEGRFAERLVAEYSAEAELKASNVKQRHARVGYMGHLYLMSCELRDFASSRSAEISELLNSTSGWADVVLPTLEATERIHNEQLGGGVPAADRGLASSGQEIQSAQGHGSVPSRNDFADFDANDEMDDDDDEPGRNAAAGGLNLDFVLDEPSDAWMSKEAEIDDMGFRTLGGDAKPTLPRQETRFDNSDDDDDDLNYRPSQQDAFNPDGFAAPVVENPSTSGGWADFSESPASPAVETFASFASFSDTPPPAAAFATDWPSSPAPPAPTGQPGQQQPPPPADWAAQFDGPSAAAPALEASRPKSSAAEEPSRPGDTQERAASQDFPAAGSSGATPSVSSAAEAWPPVSSPSTAPEAKAPPPAPPAVASSAVFIATPAPAPAPAPAAASPAAPAAQPPQPSVSSSPSVPLSSSLGAENLFALIGEGLAPSGSSRQPVERPPATTGATTSTVPNQPSIVNGPQWSLPPAAAAAPPPPPWCAMSQPGGGAHRGMPDPLMAASAFGQNPMSAPPAQPAPSGQVGADRSWMADFDPLASGGGGGASSPAPLSTSGQPTATGSDLAFLDFQWQPSA